MQDSDKAEFAKMLASMRELYNQPRPDVNYIAMYFGALASVSLADFREAANAHILDPDQGQFFPKPADIIRNITGNKGTQAEQAWTKVDKAIRTVGPHRSIVFDDRLIHAVIDDMGGWINICKVDLKGYPFRHNEFIKRYQGFINKSPARIPGKLIGIMEMENDQRGYESQAPMLIGDPEKAKLVLEKCTGTGRIGIQQLDIHKIKQLTGVRTDGE